jgi:hypothetical protein
MTTEGVLWSLAGVMGLIIMPLVVAYLVTNPPATWGKRQWPDYLLLLFWWLG